LARSSPWSGALSEAVRDGYKRLLTPSVENDVRAELLARAELAAVDVFGENLRNLLLAAPLGGQAVVGIDPGLRTGCKCVAVDQTGRFVANTTIFLNRSDTSAARAAFVEFVRKYQPSAIAVGNGTGGRFDYPPVKSDQDWKGLVNKFGTDSERFINLVQKMSEEKLYQPFVDEQYGNYLRNLDALIEHTYYHFGQVVIIRKMIKSGIKMIFPPL
ncbi:MAG: hypothetical protein AAGA66_10980, partial [Bacteroidota bacterium]